MKQARVDIRSLLDMTSMLSESSGELSTDDVTLKHVDRSNGETETTAGSHGGPMVLNPGSRGVACDDVDDLTSLETLDEVGMLFI